MVCIPCILTWSVQLLWDSKKVDQYIFSKKIQKSILILTHTQGSFISKKIQPDPCIPGSPPLVNSPETQLCASASQPCWHHQSLSLSPSSPSPSSSNPALFLRFITLLLTPVYFWSEIIGKNLNGLILRSKILECFLDWMILSSDLMMGKKELRRLRLNS